MNNGNKSRKRKHDEISREPIPDSFGNLISLVQPNGTMNEIVMVDSNEDLTKPQFGDLIQASQQVSQTLGSLLDKIQQLED